MFISEELLTFWQGPLFCITLYSDLYHFIELLIISQFHDKKSPNTKVFIHEMTYQFHLDEEFPFQLYRTVRFVF